MVAQRSPQPSLMTVDQFLTHDFADAKAELVRGELRMNPPAGGPHAVVVSNLLRVLMRHVDDHQLGRVFGDGAGYELRVFPHTVRAPDASFIRGDRLPATGIGQGFLPMAPDLAVEVLSPSETPSATREKLDDYRAAGVPLIWLIDPDLRTLDVHSRDTGQRLLATEDVLDGGDVVTDFRFPVANLFDGLAT